jgi:hypothetical protein
MEADIRIEAYIIEALPKLPELPELPKLPKLKTRPLPLIPRSGTDHTDRVEGNLNF